MGEYVLTIYMDVIEYPYPNFYVGLANLGQKSWVLRVLIRGMYRYVICVIIHNDAIMTLLALCAGNSLVIGEFPAQRPVTRSFDVFFDLCLNKRLSKQS